jgi:hypothetical protein
MTRTLVTLSMELKRWTICNWKSSQENDYHGRAANRKRLSRENIPIKYSYANTVATIDFAKQFKGHGWVGIRYQIEPDEDYNEIILHIRFKETDARLQQETLGILGVNLIYGILQIQWSKRLLRYLYDHLDKDQLEIDTINFLGLALRM